jgi:transposase
VRPLHPDEISRNLAEGAHAVLLLDRAGRHITGKLNVPDNITPIFLPSRAPELNPVENVWQYLRQNWLSNTVFENYDAIVDPHAKRGANSSPTRKGSHLSACETGPMSVNRYDPWL